MKFKIFTFPNCEKCEEVKECLKNEETEVIDLKTPEGLKHFLEYYNKNRDAIKRDNNGQVLLPVVIIFDDEDIVGITQSVEELK